MVRSFTGMDWNCQNGPELFMYFIRTGCYRAATESILSKKYAVLIYALNLAMYGGVVTVSDVTTQVTVTVPPFPNIFLYINFQVYTQLYLANYIYMYLETYYQ